MPVIPTFRRLRQEELEFQGSLGYIMRPCLEKKWKKKDSIVGLVMILSLKRLFFKNKII
jgi:hypothetical protein